MACGRTPFEIVQNEIKQLNDKFDSIVQRLNYLIVLTEGEERSDDEDTQPFEEDDSNLEEPFVENNNNNVLSNTRSARLPRRAFKSPRRTDV